MNIVFSRRRLAAMSIAGALSPIAGSAQTIDQTAPVVTPPVVNPYANLLAAAAAAPALGQIDKAKPHYLYFQRSIDVLSARHLRDTLVKLVDADVADITLVLNSPAASSRPPFISTT